MSHTPPKRILVFGYFGYVTNQLDGQTIKTRALYELLREKCPDAEVEVLDSQELQFRPIKTILKLLKAPFGKDTVFYLPGQNNLSRFFPTLYRLCKLAKSRIVYPVVGGWLPDFVADKPQLKNKLKNIDGVLVESQRMVNQLQDLGFANVEILENFRQTEFKPEFSASSKLRFVFMARLCREKGCNLILEAVDKLNKFNPSAFTVDFYGPKIDDFAEEFLGKISKMPNVEYHGTVAPHRVFETLNQYDCLLLPTYYEGEGFPGSIVDSFFAGIPAIVSDWKDLGGFIEDGETGFVIPPKDADALTRAMGDLIDNPGQLEPMKRAAYSRSKHYTASAAWEIIKKYV